MLDIPIVKINEIIEIGEHRRSSLKAVVYDINPDKLLGYDIQVVYQQGGKYVKTEVSWNGKTWQFVVPHGMGYSLNDSESSKFKNILEK